MDEKFLLYMTISLPVISVVIALIGYFIEGGL